MVALCLLASASFATPALAQTQLGTVFGVITDTTGGVLPGVKVTLFSLDTGLKRDCTTDTEGQFRLSGLPIGTYTVRIEKEGFQTTVREAVALTTASAIAINVSLHVGARREEVRANTEVAIVDSITSTVEGTIGQREMRELPLNGRDLFQAALLEPGVAPTPSAAPSLISNGKFGQVAINGMRPSWTNVTLDGMDANEIFFGVSPAGSSGLFLGLDELSELHILTQTFSAEYGRNGGGVVDAITRSGSNQWHGSLFELHRNAALDAKNYFDLAARPIPHFVRNQFGGTMGGPLVHDRTFFFANYEGFREEQANTAIATAPDVLAHQGLLPSTTNPSACSSATPNNCVAVSVDPRIQPYLNLFPLPNGKDNGDGTADLITANAGNTDEHHGMVRIDQNFSNTHSLFVRYIIDDSSSFVPYFGTPPGTYVPDFPMRELGRNQYLTVQDRENIGHEMFNELRFGVNRTTASTSIIDAHRELSFSLLPSQPFGVLDVEGLSLLGNSPVLPLGVFSTTYQLQNQISRATGRHTLKFGGEFRRIEVNGPVNFPVDGLYFFQDLRPFGMPAQSSNPPLEFFLEARAFSYLSSDPAKSDSDRGYRQSVASGFVQDYWRVTKRLTVNAGLRYDFYSNPTEAQGRLSAIRNPTTDSGPTAGKLFASTPIDLLSPQFGFAWTLSGDGKTVLRGGTGIFRDQFPAILYGVDRYLPPFFEIISSVLPSFRNPLNSALTQPLFLYSMTYHPKFPYALQYNLNLEREITPKTTLTVGYLGARGIHLLRGAEENPFLPALGRRFNADLPSPLLTSLTDAQSFYNALEVGVSKRYSNHLSLQVSYTFSHSVDDASIDDPLEAVNEPPSAQDVFNRKGDRGRSEFDIRHNFVGNAVYELPLGHRRGLGGWEVSGIASLHSDVPFSPVLSFDNADKQSLLPAERPNLVGNPYAGVCPNHARVGSPTCWFNPRAFALPPVNQFGNAGRNILRGPSFAQFDLALRKTFPLAEGKQITFGAEAFNLLNHPNFAVPSNTQTPLTQGGNGDAVFKDAASNFADNVGRIFSTVSSARQIELAARFDF
ncbi:MAG TPA: TonB-dependent receptor [Candidatus Binatia bacterium]|nr:TonB-dependent receptor [Candidatus Binatia bacterium]